jgi:stage V sporulation protein G
MLLAQLQFFKWYGTVSSGEDTGARLVIEKLQRCSSRRRRSDRMEITDIRIRHVSSEGKLKAYVTVTFDDCFVVHNVKVIQGKGGTFIAMPSRRTKTGEYKDVAHPINSDFRNVLQSRILSAFEQGDEFPGAERLEEEEASAEQLEGHPG